MENKYLTKNKNIAVRVIGITLFIVAVALIYLIVSVKSSAGLSVYKRPDRLDDGWKVVNTDGTRTDFNSWSKDLDATELIIERSLDFAKDKNYAIGFYNYYSAASIYINDELIREYGKLSDFEEKSIIGNAYIVAHIDKDVTDADVIRIKLENPTGVCIYGVDYGYEKKLSESIMWEYMSVIVSLVITLVSFALILGLKLAKRTRKYVFKHYWYFFLFIAVVSLWQLFDSQYLQIMGVPSGTVCLAAFELYYIMPVTLLLFAYVSDRYGKVVKVLDIILSVIVFVNVIYVNLLYFLFDMPFEKTLLTPHIMVAATLVLFLIQLIVNLVRAVKFDTDELKKYQKFFVATLIGFSVFIISCIVQFAKFTINPSDSNTSFLRFGTIIFSAVLIYNIVRRINDGVEEERIANHDKLWEEKQRVENSRAILNDAFKTIIPEEYIPEIIEQYKKRNDLEKNGLEEDEDSYLNIGHSMKYATILVSDIRGFSEISSKMNAGRLGEMLNHYLATMTQIVEDNNGHVLEFMGDGILAAFGAEEENDTHADDAVAAAIEMQRSVKKVNEWNEKHGFPNYLEIGVGINTGYVFAGVIGSLDKFKFDVLGSNVNLASRIESYTIGGQVLISEDTKYAIRGNVGIVGEFKSTPKGFDREMTYYFIRQLGDHVLEFENEVTNVLNNPIRVQFCLYEDKNTNSKRFEGLVTEVGENSIVLRTEKSLNLFDTIHIEYKEGVTCKVMSRSERGVHLRFTSSAKHFNGADIFEDKVPEEIDVTVDGQKKKVKTSKTYSFLD